MSNSEKLFKKQRDMLRKSIKKQIQIAKLFDNETKEVMISLPKSQSISKDYLSDVIFRPILGYSPEIIFYQETEMQLQCCPSTSNVEVILVVIKLE